MEGSREDLGLAAIRPAVIRTPAVRADRMAGRERPATGLKGSQCNAPLSQPGRSPSGIATTSLTDSSGQGRVHWSGPRSATGQATFSAWSGDVQRLVKLVK
jgi:hypothetical protein